MFFFVWKSKKSDMWFFFQSGKVRVLREVDIFLNLYVICHDTHFSISTKPNGKEAANFRLQMIISTFYQGFYFQETNMPQLWQSDNQFW